MGHWKEIPLRSENCFQCIFSIYLLFDMVMEARRECYQLIPRKVGVVDRDQLLIYIYCLVMKYRIHFPKNKVANNVNWLNILFDITLKNLH